MPHINKLKRHGIMHTGVWNLDVSKGEENFLTPVPQARLSDATNIRSVILDFRAADTELLPFFPHGGMAYSFNFFLSDFHKLKGVELDLPFRPKTEDQEVDSLREKKLSDSIELGNSRLGTGAKLSIVTAYHFWHESHDFEVGF
jgi:hypothetical protein